MRAAHFKAGGLRVRFSDFSLAELAAVLQTTALDLKSDKRSHHLSGCWDGEGHFSSRDVAELLVRYSLRSHGVGLDQSEEVACLALPSVLWRAVASHHGMCTITGAPREAKACFAGTRTSTLVADKLTDLYHPLSYIRLFGGHAGCARDLHCIGKQERRLDLKSLGDQLARHAPRGLFEIDVTRGDHEQAITLRSAAAPCELVDTRYIYEMSARLTIKTT